MASLRWGDLAGRREFLGCDGRLCRGLGVLGSLRLGLVVAVGHVVSHFLEKGCSDKPQEKRLAHYSHHREF